MKKQSLYISLFLIFLVLIACNTNPNEHETNVKPPEKNNTLIITSDSLQLFDSLQSNDYIEHINIKENNSQDRTQTDVNYSVLSDTAENNHTKPILTNEEISTYMEIDSLIQLLNYYDMQVFDDCISVETSVKDFTNRFFIVVNNIQTNDSLAIAKLKGLENFLTVFEEDFENVETNCPDLYNDYMEYLDNLIDEHYQKLENIFGKGNAMN